MERKARRQSLTESEREAIRAYHKANPRLFYREVAAHFKVGVTSVFIAINGSQYKASVKAAASEADRKQRMAAPPVVQSPLISWKPDLARLMGGNARRAKSFAA